MMAPTVKPNIASETATKAKWYHIVTLKMRVRRISCINVDRAVRNRPITVRHVAWCTDSPLSRRISTNVESCLQPFDCGVSIPICFHCQDRRQQRGHRNADESATLSVRRVAAGTRTTGRNDHMFLKAQGISSRRCRFVRTAFDVGNVRDRKAPELLA